MNVLDLKKLTQDIVAEAQLLNAKHTNEGAPVNYACIFTQTQSEYEKILDLAKQIGIVAEDTTMGPVFEVAPIMTNAGNVQLLKIRRPDPKRPERGDADFTVSDYELFKRNYLDKPGFSLIKRENMEMIELIDPSFNVLAYYSHPTLAETLKFGQKS